MEKLRAIGQRILALLFTILTLGLVEVSTDARSAAEREQAPIAAVEPDAGAGPPGPTPEAAQSTQSS